MLLLLCIAGFLAAFVDSMAGGGGNISVPALMMTGLPPAIVLGTNKMASTMGASISSLSFFRSGSVQFSYVRWLIPFTAVGAAFGVWMVKHTAPEVLKPIVVVMLILVIFYTLVKKDWKKDTISKPITVKTILYGMVVAFVMGFYDGFFGPGTGSFLIFAFLLLGFNFLNACANAKILNFTSNLMSLAVFVFYHSINLKYGLVMGASMIPGAYLGTKLAIANGAKYIRPIFLLMTFLLIGKLALTH
jgi:uncharacterized membrane protein YfcA